MESENKRGEGEGEGREQGAEGAKPQKRLSKNGKSFRGFAAMSPEKQREIASLGGRAAHAIGTAHEFTPEEARAAGRKGGQEAQRRKGRRSEP